MRYTLLLAISTAVLFLATPRMASAQLEIGSSGAVAIGPTPASPTYQLKVGKTTSTSATWNMAIRADYVDATSDNAFGVYGRVVDGANNNRGVVGIAASSDPSSVNYGIYGSTGASNGTTYAGYFNGDVRVTGTFTNPSDASLKEDVRDLASSEGVLSRLMRLRPHSFVYTRNPAYAHMSLPDGEHFGLIAQEVEQLFPNLVQDDIHPVDFSDDEEGETRATGEPIHYKSVNYIEMIPLLLQAMQEQQATIEEQQRRIEALEAGRGRR